MGSDSKTAQDVIYLVSCSANGRKPEMVQVGAMDLDQVFSFASRHKVAALAAAALVQAGCKDQRAQEITAREFRRAVIFENALEEVKKGLTERGIWFMPLKGAVLKKYYPGTRTVISWSTRPAPLMSELSWRTWDIRRNISDQGLMIYTIKHQS